MAASRGQRSSASRGSGGSRELTLSLTAVGKIMKEVLQGKGRISKEAKERVQECSSKFAAVIIKRAAQECKNDGRSEIDGRDIILAMSYLGLHDYVDQLKNYLRQYWNIDETEPLAAVGKIMKEVLPAKATISKEAKESVQELSSKFAAVITHRAARVCENEGGSEIDGNDIILAMSYLGLHDYVDPLKNYLHQYRNIDEPEPLTAVGKIMKEVLPAKARISKEAKESVQELSSKFAAVITKSAALVRENEGGSDIDGDDIILAMSYLGFHDYVDPLENYLRQYWNIDEPESEPEPEPEMSTRPTPECRLRQSRDDGDYPNEILAVGTAESFQHLSALILRKIY